MTKKLKRIGWKYPTKIRKIIIYSVFKSDKCPHPKLCKMVNDTYGGIAIVSRLKNVDK
jgi:hypothetical protein